MSEEVKPDYEGLMCYYTLGFVPHLKKHMPSLILLLKDAGCCLYSI